jgi:hypothetical protein
MQVRELGHASGSTLARPSRAIQRKSIHRLSTVGCFALLTACAGSGESGIDTSGRRLLTPEQVETRLSPGQLGPVSFVLRSGGLPLGGQLVKFTIEDPDAALGATLVAPREVVTNAAGVASVVVRAGIEAQFQVHARAGTAEADAVVIVAVGPVGSVVVVPFFSPTSVNASNMTTIEVRFLEGMACRDIAPTRPPMPVLSRISPAMRAGESARFDNIQTDQSSAVVGRAIASQVVAAGCIDVFGSSLLPGEAVEVPLRLDDVVPDPVGFFALTSMIDFSPPPAAAVALATTWRDLADCPLDPAQMWLDCTIDALSPTSSADPLDCTPSRAPAGETALGDALMARRAFILDASRNPTSCRSPTFGDAPPLAVSLDAVVFGLYGSPLPEAIASLPAIANDAAHILDRLSLASTFDIRAGVAPSSYLITHTLLSATLGPENDSFAVKLGPLGLPVLEARATAAIREGLLAIDGHSFTLRLGTAAKAVFAERSLVRRGLPGDAAGLIGKITAFARSHDGTTTGCDALDGTLCALVSRPAGCLIAACNAGVEALSSRLGTAFDAADGTGLDLSLSGSAPLLDPHGSGVADRLGSGKTGEWSVELRTNLGRTEVTGRFEGSRP